jgi:gliding motility-associated-like protein
MRSTFVNFLKPIIVFLLFTFAAAESQATHFMGVDISYECLGPCIYRITHKTYYDCTGAATPTPPSTPPAPNVNFQGTPVGCNSTPLPAGPWQLVQYVEVTPICPGFNTRCTSAASAINGVREAHYYRDYDFCIAGTSPCTKYTIGWGSCCRNGAITSGAANSGIYTGKTVIDLSITPCNSSPSFLFKPVPYICAGQTQTFIQGAFDPDGDSLSYKLVPCVTGAGGGTVTYAGGYSAAQPLGADWLVTLDPFTGEIEMSPNPNGGPVVGVLCIEVEEWRNRVKIGSVVRDMQITVITNCTSSNPDVPAITNPTLTNLPVGTLGPKLLRACVGAPICFDVPVVSKDTALNYQLIWNKVRNTMVGGSFFDPSNPTVQDTIRGKTPLGRFCWTPTAPGTYLLDMIVIDDACPIPGSASVTFLINVTQPLINSTISAVPIMNCNAVQLSAVPRSNIPSGFSNYKYTWRGNGNLQPQYNPNLNDSSFVHTYPRPATYFIDLVIEDTFGCEHAFRDFFTLSSGVYADAGPDLTICSGFQFQLGTPNIPGQFYTWTPKRGINDSTIAQPNFSLLNLNQGVVDTIDYVLHVTDSLGCETFDYVRVVVNPSLQVRISPARPTICRGDSITLRASGGTRYLWSNGDTTATIRYPYNQTTTLSVVTFDNGCTSQPEFVTIDVDPGPPGDISGSFKVCEGESAILVASGAVNYSWSTTPVMTNPITIANITNDTTVWMIPQDANGCLGDTVFATVDTYAQPMPDFTPTTVCQGVKTEFLDQTAIQDGNIVSWQWDFGDGTTSNLQNPAHTYLAAGSYTVNLNVISDNGCQATLTRSVVVETLPDAQFDFTNVCQGSPSVFTDRSVIGAPGTITDLVWKFGDGTGSMGNLATHVYDTSGYYNSTLIVTSAAGCVDSFTQTVFVHPIPVADFDVTNACQDSVVFSFNGSSVGGGLDQISTYAWNFGDPASGGNNFSSSVEPTHVYAGAGAKTVTLTVTTGNGCADSKTVDITVYEEPAADFSITGHCEFDLIRFFDNTTISPATPIVSWNWDFGNGLNSDEPNPTTRYRPVGPGTYPVVLTVISSEGCSKTVKEDLVIDPNPRTNFRGQNVCPGDTIHFYDMTTIAYTNLDQWLWDFGGPGQGPSGVQNPDFVYDAPGTYRVTLQVVSDKGCGNIAGRNFTVYENPPLPDLTEDTVCFSNPAYLIAAANSNVKVKWYDDLDVETPFYTGYAYVTDPLPSNITYYVTTTSEFGCESERFPITGYVAADQDLIISPSRTLVELPLGSVEFTPVSSITLTAWQWEFGDGNSSDLEAPVHEFENPGRYEVHLTAIDKNGCEITATTIIEVKKIVNAFMPSAFTPNGDGYNDEYKIGNYNLADFQIKIFSRWGTTVFEANEPTFKWNGKDENGRDVPEGVYVYVVRYQDINGKTTERTGSITLIR